MVARGWVLGSVVLSAVLAGCEKPNQYVAPPPPEVTVAPAEQADVTDYVEFTGRTQAVASVEIRARVTGFLEAMRFDEGDSVEAGELLYEIESSEYDARLSQAQAALESAEAQRDLAKATLERVKKAAETNAVSQIEVLASEAKVAEALAAVDAAKAQIQRAELDVSYTKIKSPIAGRVSRTQVDVGNLVGQGEPTLLTTVKQQDPLYVYFSVSERDLLTVLRNRPEGSTGRRPSDLSESDRPTVFLQLSDGTDYPQPAKIDYADNTIDPTTGTISVRALVPNPDQRLYPGLFVRVRVPQKKDGAILVPEVAVQRDLAGYFVMAVDESDVVERVDVEVGTKLASRRVIESGLEPGTRVVVNGLLRARPGIRVSLSSEGSASPADGAAREDAGPGDAADEEGGR